MPPAARGASPPGPQTGKVPAPGTVSSFLLRKNLKTGVIIHQFICSIGNTRRRVLPGRDPTAKPLAAGGNLCAQRPATGA